MPNYFFLQRAAGPLAQIGAGASSQQATRHARRIYVGGLPPATEEATIATFFSHALAAVGGNTAGPGSAVVNVYINREKSFAFVEFRTGGSHHGVVADRQQGRAIRA